MENAQVGNSFIDSFMKAGSWESTLVQRVVRDLMVLDDTEYAFMCMGMVSGGCTEG